MKIRTKLIGGFVILEFMIVFSVWTGMSTVNRLMHSGIASETYYNNFVVFDLVALALMLAISIGLSVSILRTMRIAMETLSESAKNLACGDVEKDIVLEGKDEFAELAREFQVAVDNMRSQAKVANVVANGDLTVQVTPKSDKDILGKAIKKMVEENSNALSNIFEAAYQITTSSSQVASASEVLAQGSTEQASAIQQITASIDDISDKTKENAKEATKAAELMRSAMVNVENGKSQMQDMMTAMEDINVSSESISKIIKVIDDIAFQTNILALNAAVEAARAGEAGKGFAVVAEEVRNLAAKSAAAASETAELIEDSIGKVAAGSKIADETSKAIATITEVVKESESIVEGIAEASNYQATAIGQVDQAIEQVSQVVQNNSATSEEFASSSIELSNQANRMIDLLAVYNLGRNVSNQGGSNRSYTSVSSVADKNEQIISLGSGFGKY